MIGSKIFPEQVILSEMLALYLEREYGLEVERNLNLGGSKVAFDALVKGDIDIYPEYTGTGYILILGRKELLNADETYKIVSREFEKKYNILWSEPIGFNNTFSIAIRKKDPLLKEVERISELKGKVGEIKLAAPHEFFEREDGYEGFKKLYALNFDSNNVSSMNPGLMYSALRDSQVDIIVSDSTDGRIKAYNLKIIEDDKNFFPPYYAAWLHRKDLIQRHPELKKALKVFSGLIDEKEMIKLNNKVAAQQIEPRTVALNFLINKGLIEGELQKESENKSFFSYAFSRKDYLLKITKEHLTLSFGSLFFALLFSLPTGIYLTRLPRLQSSVFSVINTVQTIPSLALLGFLIPFLGIGFKPAILALFLYSLLPLVRNTYTGIKSVDSKYIEASKGLGLSQMQILFKVELPLALPVILAGIRTASVIVIGTATLAALVGAGGYGDPIFRGVSTVNSYLILMGAIPSAILAVATDKILGWLEKKIVSPGLLMDS